MDEAKRQSQNQTGRKIENSRECKIHKFLVLRRINKGKGIGRILSETSIIRSGCISIICCAILSYVLQRILYSFGISMAISESNKDVFLSIITTHVSVVFLSTSLIASLSEKDEYIYWVNIVREILIKPVLLNFHALCTYAFSTAFFVVVGYILARGTWIIAGSAFGSGMILLLFYRMISLYYSKDKISKKYRKQLCKMVENEGSATDVKKILEKLENVTLIEAEKKEFEKVINNCELLLDIILRNNGEHWSNIQITNGIVTPLASENEFAAVKLTRMKYMELLERLALECPNEIFRHINENIGSLSSYERERYYYIISTIGMKFIDAGDQNSINGLIKLLGQYFYRTDHDFVIGRNKYTLFMCSFAKVSINMFVSYIRSEIAQCMEMLVKYIKVKADSVCPLEYLELPQEVVEEIDEFMKKSGLFLDAIAEENSELYSEVVLSTSYYYFGLYSNLYKHNYFSLVNETIETYFLPFMDINSENELLWESLMKHLANDTTKSEEEYEVYIQSLFDGFTMKYSDNVSGVCTFFESFIEKVCCFDSYLYANVPDDLEATKQEKVAVKYKLMYLEAVWNAVDKFRYYLDPSCYDAQGDEAENEAYLRLYGKRENDNEQKLIYLSEKYQSMYLTQYSSELWENLM